MPITPILADIRRHLDRQPVVVVALDGPSAAGKSTLAARLAADLDAAVVHLDDFYRDLPADERNRCTPEEGVDRYFDWERIRDEALVPLRAGRAARYRVFDWAAGHGLAGAITVAPAAVIVLEGVYSARAELAHLVDLTVLVDTGADERERRRRARHDELDDEARWDAAERVYFGRLRPRDSFDHVVDGARPVS